MNTKTIKKLHDKKNRTESGLFLVQGEKNILELVGSDFVAEFLYCTPEFLKDNKSSLARIQFSKQNFEHATKVVDESELKHMGTLEVNNAGILVVRQKKTVLDIEKVFEGMKEKNKIILALDTINDPGNLGTIIRIADWYGVDTIVAAIGTTDFYNPKTISATMGSFTRVSVHYVILADFLKSARGKGVEILGSDLKGSDIHKASLPKSAVVVMGSESHGLNNELSEYITQKIMIPRFGKAESLNVGVATAVILDNLKR